MTADIVAVSDRIAQARRDEASANAVRSQRDARLSKAIEQIRRSYHDDWEARRMGEGRRLLASLAGGVPVPVLSVCGHGTAETRYTHYLAYFLSPSRPHGLGARYLEGLLSLMRLSNPSVPEDIAATEATVAAEVFIGNAPGREGRRVGCTCDVVVTGPRHVLFIEHKVKAGQSVNPNSADRQLKRYDIAIDNNPEYRGLSQTRVYLSPRGGGTSGLYDWLGLSHNDLAQTGLALLREGGLSLTAGENLRRFIMDVLLGPYEQAEDEIRELEARAMSATQGVDSGARLRFDRMVDRNRLLVDLLLEESR